MQLSDAIEHALNEHGPQTDAELAERLAHQVSAIRNALAPMYFRKDGTGIMCDSNGRYYPPQHVPMNGTPVIVHGSGGKDYVVLGPSGDLSPVLRDVESSNGTSEVRPEH